MHYHWLCVLSVLSAALLADLTTPPALPWGDLRVMHTWNTVPANWESLGPPPADATINLHFALKPHHQSALIDALYEVSSPGHKKYGAHLSKERVADLVAPHQDTLKIVHSWLEYHGVPSSSISTSHGGGWLTITGVPVSQADEILCASYQLYMHNGTNVTSAILRTVSYALPAVLHAHVQTVAPTTHFAFPRALLQTPRKRTGEEAEVMVNSTSGELARVLRRQDSLVTPSFLRWLYHMEVYTPTAVDQNVLGTLGFLNNHPIEADLSQFMANFRADAAAIAAGFTVVSINGAVYEQNNPGPPASVNTQYSEAMAYPTQFVFYNVEGEFEWSPVDNWPVPGDGYLAWFDFIFGLPLLPQTISTSYANPEAGFPQEYARVICDLFAHLGLRGVSVLVVSGDDGVGRGNCKDGAGAVRFIPMFPASCPWVTTVGGTTSYFPEVAADFSGGGFSSYFARPPYQNRAVSNFLQFLGVGYTGFFHPEGRGYPDISAQARRFLYIHNSVLYETSGTICSTSTVAGIVSLLNDYRLSRGETPLGFLNPWLYSDTLRVAGLNDITSGSNPGCNTYGFFSVPGWDPVTGLGTPDFEILQRSLPLPGMYTPTVSATRCLQYAVHSHTVTTE